MNKRSTSTILLALFFIVIVVSAVNYFWTREPKDETNRAIEGAGIQNDQIKNNEVDSQNGANTQAIPSESVVVTENTIDPKLNQSYIEKLRQLHEAREKENVEIGIYGRIVDQDGSGVGGVLIKFTVSGYGGSILDKISNSLSQKGILSNEEKEYEISTDGLGNFDITEFKGSLVKINSIEKPGYQSPIENLRYISFGPKYSTSSSNKSDPSNPLEFKIWKSVDAEKLLKSHSSFSSKRVGDGKLYEGVYTLNIVTNEKFEGVSNKGDVVIRFSNNAAQNPSGAAGPNTKYDWFVSLQMLEGGFVESNDYFMSSAPEAGYQESIEFGSKAADANWHRAVPDPNGAKKTINYYFKNKNGNYGSFKFNLVADVFGRVFIHFEDVFLNPAGSRNLAKDPSKIVVKRY